MSDPRITDEMVEVLAKRLYAHRWDAGTWEVESDLTKGARRAQARDHLEAALQHMPTPGRIALRTAINEAAVLTDLAKYFNGGDVDRFVDAILALAPVSPMPVRPDAEAKIRKIKELCNQAKDQPGPIPRDQYGPIGRAPIPRIKVATLDAILHGEGE